MVELAHTSAIFGLAFVVNAMFIVVLNVYLKNKKELYTIVRKKIVEHQKGISHIDSSHLQSAIYKSVPRFKKFNGYFFLTCLALCTWSLATSFYFLLLAAIDPKATMDVGVFIILSIVFIIANPIVYFLFQKGSAAIISHMQENLDISSISADAVVMVAETSEFLEGIDNVLWRAKKERILWAFRRWRKKIPRSVNYLNPFRIYRDWKIQAAIKRAADTKSNV